jgi:hypothetical protein
LIGIVFIFLRVVVFIPHLTIMVDEMLI